MYIFFFFKIVYIFFKLSLVHRYMTGKGWNTNWLVWILIGVFLQWQVYTVDLKPLQTLLNSSLLLDKQLPLWLEFVFINNLFTDALL